jgi:hypothetical protein
MRWLISGVLPASSSFSVVDSSAMRDSPPSGSG